MVSQKVIDMLNDMDGTNLLVEIQSAITPEQAAAVKALANPVGFGAVSRRPRRRLKPSQLHTRYTV
jgi:hypothetical protein